MPLMIVQATKTWTYNYINHYVHKVKTRICKLGKIFKARLLRAFAEQPPSVPPFAC